MGNNKKERILIKLSGEALIGKEKYGIELKIVDKIAKNIKSLIKQNVELCVVIGGGNIFRGLAASAKGMDRANADYMGMLATVMNSLAMQNALEKLKLDTRVMSAFPIQSICETYIRRRAIRHMEKGRVVICAAGTGNPYFSTDTAAALRAAELKCSYIYKATQVDGIYNKDPKKNKDAKKYKKISYNKYLSDNLKIMDSAAISVARENKIPIRVFSILEKDCFKSVYNNILNYSEINDV
ncbi:UMP kinase [Pelagibacteraceae bacterium]|nr:UMP kinase [Pelagibacteraceae bacterium]